MPCPYGNTQGFQADLELGRGVQGTDLAKTNSLKQADGRRGSGSPIR